MSWVYSYNLFAVIIPLYLLRIPYIKYIANGKVVYEAGNSNRGGVVRGWEGASVGRGQGCACG